MEQITIWDILQDNQKNEVSCLNCIFSMVDDTNRHCLKCTDFSAYVKAYDIENDERLTEWEECYSEMVYIKGLPVSGVMTDGWRTPVNIDRVEVGVYAGRDAEIGLRYCVSGPGDIFDVWVPVMWRTEKQ